jgi:hypothetical protein
MFIAHQIRSGRLHIRIAIDNLINGKSVFDGSEISDQRGHRLYVLIDRRIKDEEGRPMVLPFFQRTTCSKVNGIGACNWYVEGTPRAKAFELRNWWPRCNYVSGFTILAPVCQRVYDSQYVS